MEGNIPNRDNGPEIPEFVLRAQYERQKEKLENRANKIIDINSRKRKVKFTKKDIILLVLVTGLAVATTISNAAEGFRDIFQHKKGAKFVTNKLVENGIIPANLKIDFFLEAAAYDVSYDDINGEKVSRMNVNIQDFVHDIYVSGIDDGAQPEEIGTALAEAGLRQNVIEDLVGVTSEQISQCELESFYEWNEIKSNETGSRGRN